MDYKNRLRYLVARYGYSTSVFAWEFFNEVQMYCVIIIIFFEVCKKRIINIHAG